MMLPLAILYFVFSAHVMAADNSSVDGLTYEDLPKTCYPLDTCVVDGRLPDPFGPWYSPTCSCHVDCARLGTCCIDSPHRGLSPTTHKCQAVLYPETNSETNGYYMHQSCPENSAWKPLCEGGLDEDGDMLKIAPVSSLDTNTTYKNYYCFKCNEQTDNFLYWNLKYLVDYDGTLNVKDDSEITYHGKYKVWTAKVPGTNNIVLVNLKFVYPPEVDFFAYGCNPQMVTDCPDSWKDDDVRSKCHSYMASLYQDFGPLYKNAHCALCNSFSLNQLPCIHPGHAITEKSFTLIHLINVNLRDDTKEKCADGKSWEPYSKKCRKLSCALPGYVIKDGECVAP